MDPKIEAISKLNFFDILILRGITRNDYAATTKQIRDSIELFYETHGLVELPTKPYFYAQVNELMKMGLIRKEKGLEFLYIIPPKFESIIRRLVEDYFDLFAELEK